MAYSWREARILVDREIEQQRRYAERGDHRGLHIPTLLGPQGIGKTELFESVALDLSLELVVVNLGEMGEPLDVGGAAFPTQEKDPLVNRRVLEYLLPKLLAKGVGQPCLLLFDDIDKAPPRYQGVLLGITGTRFLRDLQLHKSTVICCAGNRLGDDSIGNEISQSLLTRITPIEMEANINDFTAYGVASGEIHEAVMGFLRYNPTYLHKPDSTHQGRFPTPRGWKEVSADFLAYPDSDINLFAKIPDHPRDRARANWSTIVSLKCGAGVGHDFDAWWTVVRKIDVEAILLRSDLSAMPAVGDVKERLMWQYAAVFAVASKFNRDPKQYPGLDGFCSALQPEQKVAWLAQLNTKAKELLRKHYKATVDEILKVLVT